MTPRQVRSKVGVVTTTLGLAVLLAGPACTFGLGVPSVGGADAPTTQVTDTVQSVVQTTQQSAATTVPNVESTVQTAVQTTTQATAPQPSAPAAAPKPSAPATVKQTVTRAAAPVKTQATVVPHRRASTAPSAASTPKLAKQARGASATPVRRAAVNQIRSSSVRSAHPSTRPTSAAADPAPSGCAVPQFGLVPGGEQLQALLAIVCDAVSAVDLPARLGLAPVAGAAPANVGALGGVAPTLPGTRVPRARGRSTSKTTDRPIAGSAGRPGAEAAQAAAAGLPPAGPRGVGIARGGRLAFANGGPVAKISPPSSNAMVPDAAATRHHHHSWFSGQTRGTELLVAIIFANVVILAAIALWRLAVRFVIPRFA
jgi:hypothetical protein